MNRLLSFYKDKNVFITGSTGFIGAWLCAVLAEYGAYVTGFALPPAKESLYNICDIGKLIKNNTNGDVRDFDQLYDAFRAGKPDIVFHLAAQPDTREGFANPAYTYEINLLGTINIMECMRLTECVHSAINLTADIAYLNNKWSGVFSEHEAPGGYGPYTVSKSCAELITQSYVKSFFRKGIPAISTVRTGCSIGGGDFADNRLVPDFITSIRKCKPLLIKNQNSIIPYLHVLDTINALLMIAEEQFENMHIAGAYNIGPNEYNLVTAGAFADLLCSSWGSGAIWSGKIAKQDHEPEPIGPDYTNISHSLMWQPTWNIEEAVKRTVDWYKAYINGEDPALVVEKQIYDFAGIHKWPLIKLYSS